jgi:hypothetical protein
MKNQKKLMLITSILFLFAMIIDIFSTYYGLSICKICHEASPFGYQTVFSGIANLVVFVFLLIATNSKDFNRYLGIFFSGWRIFVSIINNIFLAQIGMTTFGYIFMWIGWLSIVWIIIPICSKIEKSKSINNYT